MAQKMKLEKKLEQAETTIMNAARDSGTLKNRIAQLTRENEHVEADNADLRASLGAVNCGCQEQLTVGATHKWDCGSVDFFSRK